MTFGPSGVWTVTYQIIDPLEGLRTPNVSRCKITLELSARIQTLGSLWMESRRIASPFRYFFLWPIRPSR